MKFEYIAIFIAMFILGQVVSSAWRHFRPSEPPPPANPAAQSFFDANAYVSEHVTAASEQLIKSVGHCDGDCIVIMVVNDSLVYRSNIPRQRGIEILEIASSAMRQSIED